MDWTCTGAKTYIGATLVLLGAVIPNLAPDVRQTMMGVGLALMGVGLRHAIGRQAAGSTKASNSSPNIHP